MEEKRRSLDNKYSVLYNKSIESIKDNKKYYGNEVAEFGLKVTNEVEKVASTCFDTISKVLKTLF